jgi:hypothetical protein
MLTKEALAIKVQEKDEVVKVDIFAQGEKVDWNKLFLDVITRLEMLVSAFQTKEIVVASKHSNDDVVVFLLGFPGPRIQALQKQVDI